MANETPESDPWLIAESEEDGFPIIFRMRETIPASVQPAEYPHLISILWQLAGNTPSGMPSEEDLESIIEFEDRLDVLEGDDLGYMMVSITGNGRKEWLWYVASPSAYMTAVNGALFSAAAPFPVNFAASEDPGWKTFRAFLGNAKRP